MTADGKLIEIQGTAERAAFDRRQLGRMVELAAQGCRRLWALQKQALGRKLPRL